MADNVVNVTIELVYYNLDLTQLEDKVHEDLLSNMKWQLETWAKVEVENFD